MNQRNKRASERKKQDTNGATMATGGHVVRHIPNEAPEVRVQQAKATGDVKPGGLAKASPFFKPLETVLPKTKAEEKKAVAEATEQILKDEDKK